jgi:type I restriction enzyme, S subunit
MVIPLPPREEIDEIVRRLDYLLVLGDATEHEYTEANAAQSRLRQSILKTAFEGRLVPQDPTDEPASVLLARLRDGSPSNGARRRRARGVVDVSHPSLPGLIDQASHPQVGPAGND